MMKLSFQCDKAYEAYTEMLITTIKYITNIMNVLIIPEINIGISKISPNIVIIN